MKRKTALKKCKTVADRIKAANGLIGTPHANFQALRISRAWLFGSTAKGKENPSDVDILIECKMVGFHQTTGQRASRIPGMRGNAKKVRYGFWAGFSVCCFGESKKYLTRGMYKVRIHNYEIDGGFGDIPETKIMIYPKFLLGN
jgi:hypothetical protein